MFQKLGDHIAACRKRAAECEAAAKEANDPALQKNLVDLGVQWEHVAKTYEFVASLERFLTDQQRQTLPHEVLPKDGPEP
jgi:hypothetical protein